MSGPERLQIEFHDLAPTPADLRREVLAGLSGAQKSLPCKFFYDERGAWLFERICELDAYYLTRTETAILHRHKAEIARCLGPRLRLLELGSGSGNKTRLLLGALRAPVAYIPVDISRAQLIRHARALSADFPALRVLPVCADYLEPFTVPPTEGAARTVVFFPGSTIGNLEPAAAEAFLGRIARTCGRGGGVVVGVDLRKDPELLEAAYNDAEGVTAAFNLNLLARINRECAADFDLTAFEHRAIYDARHGRIEMHLISRRDQVVRLPGDTPEEAVAIPFAAGERIVTEHSYKYTVSDFAALAARAGLEAEGLWTDPADLFSVHLLRVAAPGAVTDARRSGG